jgi:hypothetical protein
MPKLKIDDIEFNTEDLSDDGKNQLLSLQYLETQMRNHEKEMAVYKTAHDTYLSTLKLEIVKKTEQK